MKKLGVILCALMLECLFVLAAESKKGVLRWAADVESGVPNVFFSPTDPNKVIGFEYDIAEAIAGKLGKRLQFYANDWEMLVPGLQRRQYDMLLNAIERNTWQNLALNADVALSNPYYITQLQLVVLKESSIKNFEECEGKKLGILKQSLHAEKALKRLKNVEVVVYDDEVKAYADLKNNRLQGVLLDYPESFYYSAIDSEVYLVRDNIMTLAYSAMVRSEDVDLLKSINRAIDELKKDGSFRRILENWRLWNKETEDYYEGNFKEDAFERYVSDVKHMRQSEHIYRTCLPVFAKAAWVTLKISLMAMVFASLMGCPLAILRTYGNKFIRYVVTVYVECVRGTPLLIQLLLIFYGLPTLAPYLPVCCAQWVCLSPFVSGVLALGINYSAYESEIYRAGLLTVPTGQMEAARALGMTHTQALLHVVFPQAIRTVIPPVTNDFIMLLQDSSLVSMITIVELTRSYQCLAATHFNYLQTGLMVAGFYLLIGFPFVRLARYFEKKITRKVRRLS